MNIEKIESHKAKTDLLLFILCLVWIGLKIFTIKNIENALLFESFAKIIVSLAAVFLITQYLFYDYTSHGKIKHKNKDIALKFSWIITIISVFLLYVLCKKTDLPAEFSLEIIIWISFLSYFIINKLLENNLLDKLCSKTKLFLKLSFLAFVISILGINLGSTIPKLSTTFIIRHNVIFITISIIIIIATTIIIMVYSKKLFKENKKLKKMNYKK